MKMIFPGGGRGGNTTILTGNTTIINESYTLAPASHRRKTVKSINLLRDIDADIAGTKSSDIVSRNAYTYYREPSEMRENIRSAITKAVNIYSSAQRSYFDYRSEPLIYHNWNTYNIVTKGKGNLLRYIK